MDIKNILLYIYSHPRISIRSPAAPLRCAGCSENVYIYSHHLARRHGPASGRSTHHNTHPRIKGRPQVPPPRSSGPMLCAMPGGCHSGCAPRRSWTSYPASCPPSRARSSSPTHPPMNRPPVPPQRPPVPPPPRSSGDPWGHTRGAAPPRPSGNLKGRRRHTPRRPTTRAPRSLALSSASPLAIDREKVAGASFDSHRHRGPFFLTLS
jgi:hypothetical protein